MPRIDTVTCPDCGSIAHYRPCGNRLSYVSAIVYTLREIAIGALEEDQSSEYGKSETRREIDNILAEIRAEIEYTSEHFMKYRKAWLDVSLALGQARIDIVEVLEKASAVVTEYDRM
jgi:hypothetical protein